MKIEAMPLIKLEINHMKHAIVSHIGVVGSELGDFIEKEVEKIINTYPFEQEVKKIVIDALHEHVKDYFKYGKGHKVIQQAVEEGFKNIESDGA